jgi:hypothetical protein
MIIYSLSTELSSEHFLNISGSVEPQGIEPISLQLSAWRPGRYELGNFAKNIRCFVCYDQNKKELSYKKISKDCWQIQPNKDTKKIVFSYQYYANQLDAGACYISEEQVYVNPVHCFMYEVGKIEEPIELILAIPDDYLIACQMPSKGKTLYAKDYHHLADSPFIASRSLQHTEFQVQNCKFHFWFQGKHNIDLQRLTAETGAYAKAQIAIFNELECKEYHFLYQMLSYPFRHGVEHADSTVIAMGKSNDDTDEEFHNDLLAISSHELFHLWNIKRIRPTEMWPYDYTKENYSTLGFVYEGVTTYYGDLMLLRSGVWNWEQYLSSLNSDIQRHYNNPGRFNYSVAQSSYDTWLDGYVPGVPARKTSIYVEGLLAALIADILIIKNSSGKYCLDNVMRDLYHEYYAKSKGFSEQDYKLLLEKYAGISFDLYFKEIIWGKNLFEKYLLELLPNIACSLVLKGSRIKKIIGNQEQEKLFSVWCKND